MNTDNETRKFDCSRGCVVERTDEGELKCDYRQGCCKLEVYDWLPGVKQEQYRDYFEVRFKNTRKGIYVNASGQTVKMGDLVIVEAVTGHDLGIVTLEGPVVARQMRCRKIDPATAELKKIYRKAKVFDIEKWQEAIAREHETMIRARQIAAELELESQKVAELERFARALEGLENDFRSLPPGESPEVQREFEKVRFAYYRAAGRVSAFQKEGGAAASPEREGHRHGAAAWLPIAAAMIISALIVAFTLIVLFH